MNIRSPIPILLISGFVFSGCATYPRHEAEKDQIQMPVRAPCIESDILVISATYGSGTNFADVSHLVNAYLSQPSTVFYARPEWLHVDPTPGWNKALVITYNFKNRIYTFTTGEGGEVSARILIESAHKPKKAKPTSEKKVEKKQNGKKKSAAKSSDKIIF